jgi:hypothetical protein
VGLVDETFFYGDADVSVSFVDGLGKRSYGFFTSFNDIFSADPFQFVVGDFLETIRTPRRSGPLAIPPGRTALVESSLFLVDDVDVICLLTTGSRSVHRLPTSGGPRQEGARKAKGDSPYHSY